MRIADSSTYIDGIRVLAGNRPGFLATFRNAIKNGVAVIIRNMMLNQK
jgi:hypothetical protein